MQNKPLISIIIPVYNREKLLSETLNSLISQSFTDWECILVDDRSTDGSYHVMEQYEEKDYRFKIFKRPVVIKKGANACRNYGFKKSLGSYIKWFDSDDIMLPNHLERAVTILVQNKLDFVITDTVNFNHETREITNKPYCFDRNKALITSQNLALNHIGWITDDFFGTRKIVENIRFNEFIVDGDEYNFFIKMLQQPFRGVFVDEVLTHRRVHADSISIINRANDLEYLKILATLKFQTAKDLVVYENKELICWFLSGYMRISFDIALKKKIIPYKKDVFKLICNYFSIPKGFIFILALFLAKYFNKGYNIMKYARS
ncbi:glycosyltransferase family 2 protein [Flavobacterium sp. XS2P12]|uniref:glycosyltransferase family 2 protein n=1 Tax=Flavobacterium melibiosi TaxID=3398734 RepID=UPI003A839931